MRKRLTTKKWSDIRSDLVRRLINEVSKETSVTADSNVSQSMNAQMPIPKNMQMVRDQQRMRAKGFVPPQKQGQRDTSRLQTPEVVAKRTASLRKHHATRKKRRAEQRRYKDKHGVCHIGCLAPEEIRALLAAKAAERNTSMGDIILELVTDYVTRPDKS
jgi:hypothetical protein